MEGGVVFAGMALAALLFGWLGYALARRRRVGLALGLALIPTVIGAAFFLMAAGAQGWDALGYFLIAFVFCMPPATGLGLGTLIGWLVDRNRAVERPDTSG